MIFITDELGKFEKNIIELAENVGFKECKTIEAIDLFCGISEKNDVLKEKDRYYAFIDIQSNKKHGRRRGRKKDSDKNTNTQQYTSMLNRYILDNISYKLDAGLSKSDMQSAATVSDYLMLRVYQGLSRQRERIGDEEAYEQFVREATLKAVDDGWVELIDYLEQLKYAVAGRASAQRNVMFEYQNEAFESFLDTEKAVKCNIIRNILLSDVKIGKDGRLQVIYP